jgi:uncharacterized protein (TIGR02001 family)
VGGLCLAFMASGAWAQEMAATDKVDLKASISIVTDYRFRGLSISEEAPAMQGSLELGHSSGFYVGAWASSLGSDEPLVVEVDFYGGWSKVLSLTAVDLGLLGYAHTDGSGLDYVELHGSAGWTIGPGTVAVGVNFAPRQENVGTRDNLYLCADLGAGITGAPFTLKAHIGYEEGGLAGPDGDKLDWSLGAEFTHGHFTLGATYVDTDSGLPGDADPALVFSLTANF